MKRCYLGALIALATICSVSATPAAEADNFGQRLLAAAIVDCKDTITFVAAQCHRTKAMALSAYGQWRIMQMLCTGPMKKWRCEETITEFETTAKRSLFGN
ncbi:MAG: hypothetical protein AAB927_04330 [Patescibacteria group bacterium]